MVDMEQYMRYSKLLVENDELVVKHYPEYTLERPTFCCEQLKDPQQILARAVNFKMTLIRRGVDESYNSYLYSGAGIPSYLLRRSGISVIRGIFFDTHKYYESGELVIKQFKLFDVEKYIQLPRWQYEEYGVCDDGTFVHVDTNRLDMECVECCNIDPGFKFYDVGVQETKRAYFDESHNSMVFRGACNGRVNAAKIAADLYLPAVEGCEYVHYIDGNPRNLNPLNMEWTDKARSNRRNLKTLIDKQNFIKIEDTDNDTVMEYSSLRSAAKELGIDRRILAEHLKTHKPIDNHIYVGKVLHNFGLCYLVYDKLTDTAHKYFDLDALSKDMECSKSHICDIIKNNGTYKGRYIIRRFMK